MKKFGTATGREHQDQTMHLGSGRSQGRSYSASTIFTQIHLNLIDREMNARDSQSVRYHPIDNDAVNEARLFFYVIPGEFRIEMMFRCARSSFILKHYPMAPVVPRASSLTIHREEDLCKTPFTRSLQARRRTPLSNSANLGRRSLSLQEALQRLLLHPMETLSAKIPRRNSFRTSFSPC